jgi:sialic acid synthase SpsE
MARRLGAPVGYSDHTLGIEVPLAAVALGACVLEKHFTLDRNLPGPDHRASLEPEELAGMIQGMRVVEASLGDGDKIPRPSEESGRALGRKSLLAARPLRAGGVLAREDVKARRPGSGIPPARLDQLLGRRVRHDVPADRLLTWEDFEGDPPEGSSRA